METSEQKLVEKGKEWVCLIGENNKDVLVTKTSFQRNPGDRLRVEGKKYVVLSSHGDRNCMIAVGNVHIRKVNAGIKVDYWKK